MRVSAIDSKAVADKAKELKERSEANQEAGKKKHVAMDESRNAQKQVQADKLAARAQEEAARKAATDAPVTVTITRREPTEEEAAKTYSPEEIRMKARSLLDSPVLPPEQRKILSEIITRQEMESAKKK